MLLATAASVWAQESTHERRIYNTKHTGSQPPRIDGRLDDACWAQVEWATDFTQWEPAEGVPPSQQTAFKILYDESALYIAYRAYDAEPDKVSSILGRRDRFPGDWIEINIDSYHDLRTGFSFTSSVSGTRGDEFISNDGENWDGSWDPIWELSSNIDAEGWTAEVKIPLSQLRFSDRDEQVWGIQVQRRHFRQQERSLWQPKSKKESGWVSRFGELRGIRGIRAQRQVELLPYSVGKGERFESVPGDPFLDGGDANLSVGLDGKVGVTSDLTADFTINPDFGQVEADPSEVNLTAFESFFEEKRPFFIEGRNIFDFQIAPSIAGGSFTSDNLFYSRRIGRRPRIGPDLSDGEFADVPQNSSILGAAKLSGKTGRGLSIGVLESITAREQAHIDAGGLRRDQTVEPLTNFFIGRLQQDLRQGHSRVGGMFTAVNRELGDARLHELHRAAYVGGVDAYHDWHNKTWYTAVNAVGSRVEGERAAILETQTASARYFQRPDNDHEDVDSTRTALSGHAGSARFGRSNGNLRFESGVAWRSPGFETNDAGFMRRADEVNQFSWVGYSIRNPFSIFRRMGFNANQWVDWDFGGTNLVQRGNVNFNMQFKNNWQWGGGVTRSGESISNTALRGGPSSRWPGAWATWFWVNSDDSRRLRTDFGGEFYEADDNNSSEQYWWSWLSFRASNALQLSLSPNYSTNRTELQFVGRDTFGSQTRYLLGRLDQETVSLTFRLDYTVTPNLTLQYYGAPFVSAGEYDRFKRITNARADAYGDRFHTFASNEIRDVGGAYEIDEDANGTTDYVLGDPDFNFRDFNSNLVLRWEFQPGSLLYAVWSQARSGFEPRGNFALGNDVGGLFDVHPHNIFLLKVSKWVSL